MIGKKLKKLREERGLLQKELASKINVSSGAIGMYENEKRNPDYKTLNKLADFFEVSVDYLLGRTDDPKAYVISGDEIPNELKKLGVEELGVEYEVKKHGLTDEDIKDVIDYIRFKAQKNKD